MVLANAGGWFKVIAVVLIVIGVMSIFEPAVAGLAVTVLIGWVLLVAGAAQLLGAFTAVGIGRMLQELVLGAINIIGGMYFLTHPLLGLGSLTLLLAAILFAEACLRIAAYVLARHEPGSIWLLVNGVVTILLAGMIWRQWPSSSVWAIGTLVGVNLLTAGLSRLMMRTPRTFAHAA